MEAVASPAPYRERIDCLRRTKMAQTAEKQQIIGAMDYDDWALVLPPQALRRVTRIMGASGVEITDVLLKGYAPEANHPSGGFFGPEAGMPRKAGTGAGVGPGAGVRLSSMRARLPNISYSPRHGPGVGRSAVQ